MLQIREVMSAPVLSVTTETSLRDAADLLSRHHIGGAPVLAGHTVVGVVSASDLLEFVAGHDGIRQRGDDRADAESEERTPAEYEDESDSMFYTNQQPESSSAGDEAFAMEDTPVFDLFAEHTVAEVMTHDVYSLPPDALLTDAAQLMLYVGVHRLLVVEHGLMVGVVSTSDVARAVATRRVAAPRPAVRTCDPA